MDNLDITLDSLVAKKPNMQKKRGKKRKQKWTDEQQEEWANMTKAEKKAWWAENKKAKKQKKTPKKNQANKQKANNTQQKKGKKKEDAKANQGVDVKKVQDTINMIKNFHKNASTKNQKRLFSAAIGNLVNVIKPLRNSEN